MGERCKAGSLCQTMLFLESMGLREQDFFSGTMNMSPRKGGKFLVSSIRLSQSPSCFLSPFPFQTRTGIGAGAKLCKARRVKNKPGCRLEETKGLNFSL